MCLPQGLFKTLYRHNGLFMLITTSITFENLTLLSLLFMFLMSQVTSFYIMYSLTSYFSFSYFLILLSFKNIHTYTFGFLVHTHSWSLEQQQKKNYSLWAIVYVPSASAKSVNFLDCFLLCCFSIKIWGQNAAET